MAWLSEAVAVALPLAVIDSGIPIRELIIQKLISESQWLRPETPRSKLIVYSGSRKGRLLWNIRCIVDNSPLKGDLYLFKEDALLQGKELGLQLVEMQALLAEINRNPQIVLEATKERYYPSGVIHGKGFEPLPFVHVYPQDSAIKDGWVYYYTVEQVQKYLADAECLADPKPDGDHEGESLQYVFNALKSHESLLCIAQEQGLGVAYAELDPNPNYSFERPANASSQETPPK